MQRALRRLHSTRTASSHEKSRNARSFIVTTYVLGKDSKPTPVFPAQAPCSIGGGPECLVGRHHVRERVTGPGFALTVARCRTHRLAFTLYPPGYAPYARRGVAPVAPDGASQRPEGKREKAERFRGTVFDAPLDAASGRAWGREHRGTADLWWHTQLRQIELTRAVLGLAPSTDSRLRHAIAETLAIPTIVIEEQAKGLRVANAGYRARGTAVCVVLGKLTQTPLLADRLLEAGHLAGCWGAPYRWLPDVRALRRCPFRAAGTARTAAPRRPP